MNMSHTNSWMQKITSYSSLLLLVLLISCKTGVEQSNSDSNDGKQEMRNSGNGDEKASQNDDKTKAADLVTKFQYAYFEQRFDDFHKLLSAKDRAAKSVQDFNREFETLSKSEDLMTTFILSTSDYEADSTMVLSADSLIVFGKATAPLLDKVEREVSIILRDVGTDEEMGMLLSLLQERMKLRGGLKESQPTQHLVIREDDDLRIRVGFDG